MDVNLAVWNPIDASEAVGEVSCCSIEVGVRTVVVGEMIRDRRNLKFPLEEINLVQEENDGLALEPLAIHK